MLGDKMGAGHLHMVGIAQLFFDDLHSIQGHAGRGLAAAMQVQIQVCLVELSEEIRKLFHIKGRDAGRPRIRVWRDQSRGMEGLCTVHKDLHGMDLQVFRIVFLPEALQLP